MYTHFVKCTKCKKVVSFFEEWSVKKWPNGYPTDKFTHRCSETEKGKGTTSPEPIPIGSVDRDTILNKLMPISKLDW